jgi:prolyl 4-hydroxylase
MRSKRPVRTESRRCRPNDTFCLQQACGRISANFPVSGMNIRVITPELRQQLIERARVASSPDAVLEPLLEAGWELQEAVDAVEGIMRDYLAEHAREHSLPPPVRVPAPVVANGPSIIRAVDQDVAVLASVLHPRVVVFGGLLRAEECDELIALARTRIRRSSVIDGETGEDEVHDARTSEGTYFTRGANPLCTRIEARIATLLDWPVENGEGLQVLRYGVGAQYRPHFDYFDPQKPGMQSALKRGGQRVGSVVMYLNTPPVGGATIFPDGKIEVGAIKGNAVFFSYDRPHPMTRSLHGGAPVMEGEKWVATKWLREGPHH